jgi:hypothetical protein
MTDELRQLLVELRLDGRSYLNTHRKRKYACDFPADNSTCHYGRLVPMIHPHDSAGYYLICEVHVPLVVENSEWEVYRCK